MSASSLTGIRKTLGLVGITIHAMTLIAPGAFVWLLFPLQLSAAASLGGQNTFGSILPGVVLALLTAFLTAISFSGLTRLYPHASSYSAYHIAQEVIKELSISGQNRWSRPLKLLTGWASHLFYWVYPGVMIALLTTLVDYLLRRFGYQPTAFGQVLLAASLAAFMGFLALRGITGSMSSSILLNIVQIVVVIAFSVLAIVFRVVNPIEVPPDGWAAASPAAILLPDRLDALLLQASLSILLVVGFETFVSSGMSASASRQVVPRKLMLLLLGQGFVAYLLQYFAYTFALTADSMLVSPMPLGDLAMTVGNALLAGNGYAVMMVTASTVVIAILAASLTSMNSGVRITFAMAVDDEMPEFLSLLHEKHATPYTAVIIQSVVSAVIGSAGALGGKLALAGITLTANLGAFLLYALICAMSFLIYRKRAAAGTVRAQTFAGVGLLANLCLALVIAWVAFQGLGLISRAAGIALWLALAWFAASLLYYWLRARRKNAN